MSRPISKADLEPGQRPMYLANERGQLVIEYVLLLVVGVTVALLITTTMVNRNPDEPGFLTMKWDQIIRAIGEDRAGEVDL